MRDLDVTVNDSDLIKSSNVRRETTVDAQDFVVDELWKEEGRKEVKEEG